jgi:leader peptidase (prepilin peptidase)/N-methyltransferase
MMTLPLFVFGAAIGSFLNVVIHRLPRGESIVRPASRCPGCETPIRPYDNVPILSWCLLRGRCRNCRERISPRYPAVEALTALLFAGFTVAVGPEPELVLGLAFLAILVAVTMIDLDHRIIPNRIVLAGAVIALAGWAAIDPARLVENGVAAAAAGGLLLAAAMAYPGGMGMGDVKLAAMMGLYLGRSIAPALLIGFAAGAVVGLAIMARRGVGARKQAVPFGPFLALGGAIGLFAGPAIVDWYLDSFVA